MSNISINKRIDNLGRIVIPKEIRKKLRILENDVLDLTLDNDKVIITRKADDLYNKRIFNKIILSIKKIYNIDVNIFNLNNYYFYNNGVKLDDEEFRLFIIDKKYSFEEKTVYPLYPNGLLYGGIVVNKDNDEYKKLLLCFQNFINKYLEE